MTDPEPTVPHGRTPQRHHRSARKQHTAAERAWTGQRCQLSTRTSVVNAGLGGNRLIADREGEPYYGVAALSRMERDAFEQTGVRSVILVEGINDIGYDATADELIAGYKAFIEEGHRHGLKVHGGTLLPMAGSFIWTESRQATWDAVNDWIRTSGAFDGVIDFAAATASPEDPLTLNPAYDSGDHLHPNDAGTRAMAEAVDLDMLLSHGRDRISGSGRH
ncbi:MULTISPECIES: GDSL-type esterase/lipase family protein [Streptomyces]|uniref:GDSL-type esterase/lipase family protein n=1 Tax=Streptomyces TaxID=1883 RepID=UPI0018E3B3F3|nr:MULTISPECIES: GDSL-type esterase/lipase family protein [Streptomyces]